MKKVIIHLIFIIIFNFIFNGNRVYAASEEWKINFNSNTNSIIMNWEDIGDYYSVYLKNQPVWEEKTENEENSNIPIVPIKDIKIWEGENNSFTNKDLIPNTKYSYVFIAYDQNRNVIEEALVEVYTLPEQALTFQQDFEEKLKIDSSQLNMYYTNEKVNLTWTNLPDEDNEYDIYVDDVFYSSVEGNSVSLKVEPNSKYKFKVIGKERLDLSTILEIEDKARQHKILLSPEKKEELSYKIYEISKGLDTNSININVKSNPDLKQNASGDTTYSNFYAPGYLLSYTTFIPFARIPNPVPSIGVLGGQYEYFSGDGRLYDPWSWKYRTRFNIRVTFDNAYKKSVIEAPFTGLTRGYKKNGDIDVAQAPKSDMWLTNVSTKVYNQVSFTMNHESTIPLVSKLIAPPIDYKVGVTLNANGDIRYSGYHDMAPSHEFYGIPWGSDFYIDLHRQWHLDFLALYGLFVKEFKGEDNLLN